MLKPSLLAIALPFIATPAFADHHQEPENKQPIRQHDAHVHGTATLNLVKDGNDFLIEVEAAGADILGFEHAPQTEEEKATYQQGITQLKQGEQLFVFTASAGCQLASVNVEDDINQAAHDENEHDHDEHGANEHDHDEHEHATDEHDHDEHEHATDEHDHDEHEHDEDDHDDHDEHEHDEHEHDHDEHAHDEDDHQDHGSHGAFVVQYQFTCSDANKVTSIDTTWFKQFSSTQTLDANVLIDEYTAYQKLQPNSTSIRW